jgi:hypothetical protein
VLGVIDLLTQIAKTLPVKSTMTEPERAAAIASVHWLNDALDRYWYRHRLVQFNGDRMVFVGAPPRRQVTKQNEWDAIRACVELAKEGRIANLRTCKHCGNWLFARFPMGSRAQRFCRGCLDAWRKSNIEYKREQALRVAELRKRDKEREARELKIAGIRLRRKNGKKR